MNLNYLTESELEDSRENINKKIIFAIKHLDSPSLMELLGDIRSHEIHILKKELREAASQEIQEKLDGLNEMGALYDALRKIPWYRFSERNAQRQKIEELRIKQRGW